MNTLSQNGLLITREQKTGSLTITCIAGGLIGGGWAAYFLSQGHNVIAWDPADDGESRLRAQVVEAWPHLERLGLAEGASPDRLTYTNDLNAAVKNADFIQESAPEILSLKQDLMAEIDAAAPLDCIIASSTSGLLMTEMQAKTTHPARFVVGHPFNPVYLMPLVEVVGGKNTAPAVVDRAAALYERMGKVVIKMDREVTGFVANRLQEAIFREAAHMIAASEATPEEIDTAIVNGPGIRWALHGPCMTYHLAVRNGGIGELLERLKGGRSDGYARATMPKITPDLKTRLVEGCAAMQGDRSVEELIHERNLKLIDILISKGKKL